MKTVETETVFGPMRRKSVLYVKLRVSICAIAAPPMPAAIHLYRMGGNEGVLWICVVSCATLIKRAPAVAL